MSNSNFQDLQDLAEREKENLAERETIEFARAHINADTAKLLLGKAPEGIDMPAAVQQIEGLRMAAEKWPSLRQHEEYLYPPRLNREQASSEATARYKASILNTGHCPPNTIVDLTGGMGVDTLAFATNHRATGVSLPHVDYVERDPQLCALMERNCRVLGITNASVHCADSIEWLSNNSTLNTKHLTLYIDPARRNTAGRKVAAFEDCTPDILQHLDLLRSKAPRMLVKASPMIDITLALRQLASISEVHIVAVKGECKEVLFLCDNAHDESAVVHCVNLNTTNTLSVLSALTFTLEEEAAATAVYCDRVGRYLYDPHAALRKGGCFHLLSQRYGLPLLAPNTHLYTNDTLLPDFPGRTFEVLQEVSLNRKALKPLIPDGKVHVVVRNFPTEAAALQRQLGLREGGDLFLLAATVGSRRKGFLCKQN